MIPIEQFHPLVVHFPIVFMITLAVFDTTILARGAAIGGRSSVANVSAGLAVCAGLAAVLAFIVGDIALDIAIAAGTPAARLETHEELGKITALVLLSWAIIRGIFWWRKTSLKGLPATAIVVFELAIAALIVTTAYFGGQLVYEFGIGVTNTAAAIKPL